MNIEIIKALKERAKEMLEDNYNRKIGDEELYTIICELENFYTAYEKEKEKNRQSKMRIVQLEKEIDARIEDVNEQYVSKEKIKERIKEYYEYDKRMQNKPDWHTTKYYEAKALEKLLEE